jgi:1-aminocyclopropane-1-carboxylate deaminase
LNTKLTIPSPLQKIEDPIYDKHRLEVFIKRDDLIHAEISGNKWRKLKYNFEKFKSGKYDAVLTFGGAYSNHIAARHLPVQCFRFQPLESFVEMN